VAGFPSRVGKDSYPSTLGGPKVLEIWSTPYLAVPSSGTKWILPTSLVSRTGFNLGLLPRFILFTTLVAEQISIAEASSESRSLVPNFRRSLPGVCSTV